MEACPSRQRRVTAVAGPGVHSWFGAAWVRSDRVHRASDTFWDPPAPTLVPYIASKGAVVGIMRSLARALGPDGISVTGVAPGLTDTVGARPINTDARFDAVADRQALKRRLTPDDPAAAVAFLASGGAAALTGQSVGHRRWARPSVAQHHRRIGLSPAVGTSSRPRALPPVAVASH